MSDTQVKSWSRDSIHPTHAAATERLAKLGHDREGTSAPLAKIHCQTRGFVVKIWKGDMQAAPKPKKAEAPSDTLGI